MSDKLFQTGFHFGEGFLEDHAGRIISDPQIAIVELVANSWDAGARNVEIKWPAGLYNKFEINDDGEGMTKDEFLKIWFELRYNREQNQGTAVIFPDKSAIIKRTAYGRNGKGRHALFCFADEYKVETWKNGSLSIFNVIRNRDIEQARFAPYEIELLEEKTKIGNGTRISCSLKKNYVQEEKIIEIIGAKFSVDPSFSISLNSHKIALSDLKGVDRKIISIPDEGEVEIITIDSTVSGRMSKLHGVAWWVNHRLVGEHSWKGLDEKYLDGRTSEAKRYTFIVNADILINEIKPDWTDFKDTDRTRKIKGIINSHIQESIRELLKITRVSRKKDVLFEHRANLRQLSISSRNNIGNFIDQTLVKCPSMTQDYLSKVVGILANIEASRTGARLLHQLSQLTPNDYERLSDILSAWSVAEAKIVLDELQKRLDLIKQLETLVNNASADELHELHPLFEQGLWMFGPEYEGIRFLSNKQLATVVKEFFGTHIVDGPRRRPDIIALANASMAVYSSFSYDARGELSGYDKILIIELKKGGSIISEPEIHQAEGYALALKKTGKISPNSKIVCFVLGSKIDCEPSKKGDAIVVCPRAYDMVLHFASARTFNLIDKIKEVKEIEELEDEEIKDVLSQQEIASTNIEFEDSISRAQCEDQS